MRSPAGLEWRIWRQLPRILLAGTAVLLLVAGVTWLLAPPSDASGAHDPDTLRHVFILIGAVVLHWTLVLTVAIGCAIVMLMKGPTYVADPYPLPDADRPDVPPRHTD